MAKKAKTTDVNTQVQPETVTAIKGFNKDLTCRYFQFEVGKTFKMDGPVKACERGFHAIEGHPLEVFNYYAPATSVFHEVELCGPFSRENSDSKIAAAEITIKAEIHLPQLISRAIDYVFARVTYSGAATNSGTRGAATNSGYQGAATNSGYQGAATNSGTRGAATNSGDQGAATNSGTRGAATNSGTRGAATNSGYQGAATNSGTRGAATNSGDQGAATNSGDQGAATTGAKFGAAFSTGIKGKVKGSQGESLHLDERLDEYGSEDHGKILAVWAGIVGQNGVKPDTWYTLKGGVLVEVEDED